MLLISLLVIFIPFGYTEDANALSYTAFGYLKRFGIPEYERIRKNEGMDKSSTRITGGVPAALGQYPYQAGLISDINNTTERAVCGGSLISINRVLTAAHCWDDGVNQAWRFEIVLGSVYLFQGGTRIKTSAVQVHPSWKPNSIRNDIAIIFLPAAIQITDTIAPIALPSEADEEETYAGFSGIASGFGITVDAENVTESQSLNHVRLNIINNWVCSLAYPFFIKDSNICTNSFGGASPCRGDSGGPLVVDTNHGRVLVGVTSFGSSFGCEFGLPAVFTRVSSFIEFINQNL